MLNAVEKVLRGRKRMLICAMAFDGIKFWKLLPENTAVTSEAFRDDPGCHIHN